MALPLLRLDTLTVPSGQGWPGPLTPAPLGKPRHPVVFPGRVPWSSHIRLELGLMRGKEEEEEEPAADSLGGAVHAGSRAGPAWG